MLKHRKSDFPRNDFSPHFSLASPSQLTMYAFFDNDDDDYEHNYDRVDYDDEQAAISPAEAVAYYALQVQQHRDILQRIEARKLVLRQQMQQIDAQIDAQEQQLLQQQCAQQLEQIEQQMQQRQEDEQQIQQLIRQQRQAEQDQLQQIATSTDTKSTDKQVTNTSPKLQLATGTAAAATTTLTSPNPQPPAAANGTSAKLPTQATKSHRHNVNIATPSATTTESTDVRQPVTVSKMFKSAFSSHKHFKRHKAHDVKRETPTYGIQFMNTPAIQTDEMFHPLIRDTQHATTGQHCNPTGNVKQRSKHRTLTFRKSARSCSKDSA